MTPSAGLPVLFIVSCAIVTYDEVKHQLHVPPYPQRFVYVGVAFGLLGLLDVAAPALAGALGFGIVLALGYLVAQGGSKAAQTTTTDSTATATTSTTGSVVVAL